MKLLLPKVIAIILELFKKSSLKSLQPHFYNASYSRLKYFYSNSIGFSDRIFSYKDIS